MAAYRSSTSGDRRCKPGEAGRSRDPPEGHTYLRDGGLELKVILESRVWGLRVLKIAFLPELPTSRFFDPALGPRAFKFSSEHSFFDFGLLGPKNLRTESKLKFKHRNLHC